MQSIHAAVKEREKNAGAGRALSVVRRSAIDALWLLLQPGQLCMRALAADQGTG
jgi:hypothetical protein